MNEIQIIQAQLQTQRTHFVEVAQACAAALDRGDFRARGDFAAACADYLSFAAARLSGIPSAPGVDAPAQQWRHFLGAFSDRCSKHFAAIEALLTRSLPVTEWRARSGIDADSIMTERVRYARVKAALP